MEASSEIFGCEACSQTLPQASEIEPAYESADGYSRLGRSIYAGKAVAVKSLKPKYIGNPIHEGLLKKEFEIGASLDHPGICRTLDFVPIDGYGNCMITEWIDGETLDKVLEDGRLTPGLARKIIIELCDVLDYLHHRQIVHRDIKPGNVMITRNGNNVKLIDFGFADTDTHVRLKMAAGTESYAAPEQIAGQALDERSDIYSLGKVIGRIAAGLPRRHRNFWNRFASTCTASEIGKRPDDAGQLKLAILKRERQRRQRPVIVAAGSVMAAVLLWICAPYIEKMHERHEIDRIVRTVTESILDNSQ